ncbi:class F sortase [Alkalicoccus chagannorensis]|uniref:class F sortase n=1 Tax=Alkalicoccus chagannorensis TaxID=427072 RepID=UPI0003FF9F97|nr:class F sortase [Alkalicoccus chagannorensis]
MKRLFYYFLLPLTAAGLAGAGTMLVPVLSSPSETQVMSELEESGEDLGIDLRTSGLTEAEHEFQAHPSRSDPEETESAEEEEQTFHAPTGLRAPSADIEGPVEEVGILDNGEMGVPEAAENIGWFEPGVKPGERGNAVLAGHVDSREGPAVFYDLDELEAGDEVHVDDEEGNTLTFQVTSVVQYDRREAPIEDIFGPSSRRQMNLITCTGTFNQAEGTHDDRLVVYTELVEESAEEEPPPAPTNVELSGSTLRFHAVEDERVVGYRIYSGQEDERTLEASIATYERKTHTFGDLPDAALTITAVTEDGTESEAATVEE